MKKILLSFIVMFFFLLFSYGGKVPSDLILMNGEVYTMEEDFPWASAVVISGNKIKAVLGKEDDIEGYKGKNTLVIDLKGKFVVPGFIDAHVHFNRAGSLINDANLLTVSDNEGLKREITRVVNILDEGEWITGGLWGAYEQWELGAIESGLKKQKRWEPTRWQIDDLTPKNPCLLQSFDGELFLSNTVALKYAGLEKKVLPGMRLDKSGQITGLITKSSPALNIIKSVITEKSKKRLLDENRAALKKIAESGIVEIHDIAVPGQTSRFIELQEKGELTCRVWLRPDLSWVNELSAKGYRMGLHPKSLQPDQWLRYGALKGYVDGIMGTHGALFFRPYTDQIDNCGHYRRHTSDDPEFKTVNMDKLYHLVKRGYHGGFVVNIHAIGTKGVALLLDTYERLHKDMEINMERFRVIHAQVIRPEDFIRFRRLKVIAEVNPYHISDDMRWMEERIGYERCKGAYAFQSLLDNRVLLSFGSDWPGTSAAEYVIHPKYLIHAAVNRTTLKGIPEGGWFPEQKISVHDALKAYTINSAYAAMDEKSRGSITKGKLADITVCDLNLFNIHPKDILKMNIFMTIVDGKIVFKREYNTQ